MRVIDIDPIVEKLKNAIYLGKRIYADTSDLEAILADIEAQPTADKKGKWIVQINGWGDVYFECSCCKEAITLIDGAPKDNFYYYCPHCGARMEE